MSPALGLLALLGNITFPALGHLAYKFAVKAKRRSLAFIAILCFAATSVCTFLALHALPLGFVYSASAATQGLILFFGWRFLAEEVTRLQVFAVALIALGVCLFGLASF